MASTDYARWMVLFVALLGLGPCAAESRLVELEAGNDQVAVARYWRGDQERPAMLILHGFLQTREFSTVRRLAESLAEDAYTVLAPTLTLGLMRRGQSLPGEAIHIHDMDLDELISVDGANHFFDQQTELDLLETIETILAGASG